MTITVSALPALAHTGGISEARAKEIALQDAGLSEKDVTFVRCGMDLDDGRTEYEVEFYCGNMEYDYDIDAATGAIVSMDQDAEYFAPAAGSVTVTDSRAAAKGDFTEEQALEAALKHASVGMEDVSFSNVHKDFDDGREIFEVEFYVGAMEYSYDIDVHTGEIVDFDMDMDD